MNQLIKCKVKLKVETSQATEITLTWTPQVMKRLKKSMNLLKKPNREIKKEKPLTRRSRHKKQISKFL